MITKVILRNFKCFKEEEFILKPHIILAGQNNSGKTTLIQAISAWHFALQEWIKSGSPKATVGLIRKEFAPVPLQEFNQLWTDTSTGFKKNEITNKTQGAPRALEIETHGIHEDTEWQLTMEFKYSNKDQMYVKPQNMSIIPDYIRALEIVHIPSFSGISIDEHKVEPEYQDILVGQGKPGNILRNLLQQVADKNKNDWRELCEHVENIFQYKLIEPNTAGRAFILCEYRRRERGGLSPALDINTAGSGFQQVLLLLAFLYARPATVMLIDEPDAHLHINLQRRIFHLLKDIAAKRRNQLIIATHSEVLINASSPDKIISFFPEHPRCLSDIRDLGKLQEAMKRLSPLDLLQAEQSGNKILFVEGQTDFDILRAWANALEHPVQEWFNDNNAYWHNMHGNNTTEAKKHLAALQATFFEMKGFILIDSDGKPNKTHGFDNNMHNIILKQWARYEIENYLVYPAAIQRLIQKEQQKLGLFAPPNESLKKMEGIMPPDYFNDPLNDPSGYLQAAKSSEKILPPIFQAAKCFIEKDEYYRIAEIMLPEEIHSDVRNMLDAIADFFAIKS